jgi:hypothetical protein
LLVWIYNLLSLKILLGFFSLMHNVTRAL